MTGPAAPSLPARPRRSVLALLGAALGVWIVASWLVLVDPRVATTSLAVLVVAVTAVLALALRAVLLAVATRPDTRPVVAGLAPVLADRATDPQHHPLRPRAPGVA